MVREGGTQTMAHGFSVGLMNPPRLQLESGVGLNDPTEHHRPPRRIENDNPLVSITPGELDNDNPWVTLTLTLTGQGLRMITRTHACTHAHTHTQTHTHSGSIRPRNNTKGNWLHIQKARPYTKRCFPKT